MNGAPTPEASTPTCGLPKVSIVVPCHNGRRWIGETLASTRRPYPWPVELIVVDDGSSDGSGEIIARDFPEVRLVHTANRGCSAARQHGTELATGHYLKYLDADDLLVGDLVARQVELAERTDAEVIYGNWQRLTQREGRWQPGERVERAWQAVSPDVEIAFFTTMWCPTAAYLWRVDFLRTRHPGWHANLPVIQDARFALDAAIAGARFVHDAEVGVHYRVHQGGSVATSNPLKFARDCWTNALEIRDHWARIGTLRGARRTALLDVLEYIAFDVYPRDRALAREVVRSAQSVDPTWHPTGSRWRRLLGGALGFEAVARLRTGLDQGRRILRRVSTAA